LLKWGVTSNGIRSAKVSSSVAAGRYIPICRSARVLPLGFAKSRHDSVLRGGRLEAKPLMRWLSGTVREISAPGYHPQLGANQGSSVLFALSLGAPGRPTFLRLNVIKNIDFILHWLPLHVGPTRRSGRAPGPPPGVLLEMRCVAHGGSAGLDQLRAGRQDGKVLVSGPGALLRFIVALMLCLVSATANAKVIMGAGAASCGAWSKPRDIDDKSKNTQWLLGFLSGINDANSGPDFLSHTDADGVIAWVDNYCRQHPLDHIVEAASKLATELDKAVGN
jgi:hypothetical protein